MVVRTGLFDGLLMTFVIVVVASLSNAQNTTSTTLEDCHYYPDEVESCISEYETLEAFLRADNEQIATLARSFYRTGKDPTKYIKISYLFQIPSSHLASTNDTCVLIKRNYIWSTSPVFLLGPRALLWLSLFTITVNEDSVTIRLPCLQEAAERVLLSRLTYLSRMYAQGRYVEDLDLDLASKYYFQTQSNIKEDIHYRTIYTMLFYLEVLSSLLYAFLCLTIYTWIFPAFDKSKQGLKETISPKLIKFTTLDKLKHPHYVAKGITAAIVVIPLVGFHLIAVTELYRYRQKVFQEKDALGPSSVALIFTSSVTVVYLIIFYIVYKRQKFSLKNYIMHCLTSLSIAYLGHFIPFISLAFITDPLKTVLIVTGEMLVVICVYGIVLVLVYSVQYKSLNVLLDALGWLLSAVILIAALITVLTLFSIGNFNGFDDIQELLFPLIGTVGTILIGFYLKPSSKMEEDSEAESSADKEQEMYTQEDDTTVV